MNRLQAAKQYLGYGIQEGYYDQEQFENMTDEELIKFAEYEMERGDYYANNHE